PDINAQRDHFEELSNAIVAYSKSLELPQSMFVQFCPMALNGKGAQWLATEESILNPYYGERMLRCGAVKETIN
ncbi:MAG: Cu(I)/Ag(I) efflux system membrane fusion protein, partial [Vicingaceae bacterium]